MPEATVLNVAVSPGQRVRLVNSVAEVLVFTVNVAQLVTLVQLPVTSTHYVAASSELTLLITSELLVSPVSATLALVH